MSELEKSISCFEENLKIGEIPEGREKIQNQPIVRLKVPNS